MTSEIEALKTNEFLRRRKLRIQQVREQSKDIAKKIRQRANVEKFRQLGNIDAAREKEYLEQQDKLVKRLEHLYARGVGHIGTSHREAAEVIQQESKEERTDLSKQRGKEAAAELRRKKQEKLDEKKKLLDRKLQAREAANEISREKSSAIASKLSKLSLVRTSEEQNNKPENIPGQSSDAPANTSNDNKENTETVTNEMGTQWEFGALPNEWEPHIPVLSLPKDDSGKNSPTKTIDSKEKSKRPNLFALSGEMPACLRGVLPGAEDEVYINKKNSLTLVSEYIQNRDLRLRESDTASSVKKPHEDLQSIKKTIQQTRALRPEGSLFNPVCHVADVQVVPVPSWQAENSCGICPHDLARCRYNLDDVKYNDFSIPTQRHKSLYSTRNLHDDLQPSPVIRGSSPFRRSKVCPGTFSGKRSGKMEKPSKSGIPDSALEKKSSVTMYNHSTRDVHDVPFGEKKVVTQDMLSEEDAYSQAMKETNSEMTSRDKEHQKKLQQMRNKIAMSKQSVEKEYKDTMAFLNSLSKDKTKPIKNAYKNEQQQELHKECRQRKLQMEFKKIQKECSKHSNSNKYSSGFKPKAKDDSDDDDFNAKDFQYSWMPVPESDGNLAIHTIPTAIKEHKTGNTVKFSKVDSYHEYRSRHKHTPPTKDIPHERQRFVEAVLIEEDDNGTETSETSSSKTEQQDSARQVCGDVEDKTNGNRFIIYKLVDKKTDKDKTNKNTQLLKDIAKSMSFINKEKKEYSQGDGESGDNVMTKRSRHRKSKSADNQVSLDALQEGVFKAATNSEMDNIASVYFTDRVHGLRGTRKEGGDNILHRPQPCCASCGSDCINKQKPKVNTNHVTQPSASTSTSSFKTASNVKGTTLPERGFSVVDEATEPTDPPDGGFIKFIEDKSNMASDKFYIGATGFLKDDAYEVIIQLRKKDVNKDDRQECVKLDEKLLNRNVDPMTDPEPAVEPTNTQQTLKNKSENSDKVEEKQRNVESKPASIPATDSIPTQISAPKLIEVATSLPDINSETEPKKNMSTQNQSTSDEDEKVIYNTDFTDVPLKRQVNLVDKGVFTPFQDSFAIPASFSKMDSAVKVTNSVSIQTQTTLDSPTQRPMYVQMSSSTSTAYLSPPELVLPTFLRRDRIFSCDDDYYSSDMRDPRVKVMNKEESNEDYAEFLTSCSHIRKMSITGKRPSYQSIALRTKQRENKYNRPPNTARTVSSSHGSEPSRKKRTFVTTAPKSFKKCRKCEKLELKTSAEAEDQKRVHATGKKKSQNILRRLSSIASYLAKDKSGKTVHMRQDKNGTCELNPVIKWYVNKLLALNKDGLQAIDIVNQDCSAVTTPGSSIIDVPHNINEKKPMEAKISLEQIKETILQQIVQELEQKRRVAYEDDVVGDTGVTDDKTDKIAKRFLNPRKKILHKVKSLNISRHLLPKTNTIQSSILTSGTSSSKEYHKSVKSTPTIVPKSQGRSKSSPSPRKRFDSELGHNKKDSYDINSKTSKNTLKDMKAPQDDKAPAKTFKKGSSSDIFTILKTTPPQSREAMVSPEDFEPATVTLEQQTAEALNISTQTSRVIDDEINYIKLAEDKLQNMEKIADLTEKCTKRLSNLAKVLDEVRRNKSLVYSQGSDEASDSDRASAKNSDVLLPVGTYEPVIEMKEKEPLSLFEPVTINAPPTTPEEEEVEENMPFPTDVLESAGNSPVTSDIRKPKTKRTKSPVPEKSNKTCTFRVRSPNISNLEHHSIKTRGKPPPALSRRCLKRTPDYIVPHELSTVIEVDSPQLKSQPERNDNNFDVPNNNSESKEENSNNEKQSTNPDLLQSNINLSQRQTKISTTESSDESKMQMMDLKQFNEIMLKPFISIQEYAKQCNMEPLEESSNIGLNPKDDVVTDDLSSLHSDGSLPDVIAELLKRNIISEPFKFDTASNINSTTVSSESTLSGLALTKAAKDRKNSNKENIAESSDTLSVSSNPDLENAFKKLGMGWASSTLKKTKERLALSSSSNTSSSSLSQFKVKNVNNQEFPVLLTHSVSSIQNTPNNLPKVIATDNINKNAEQQTSLTNSMTVKQFLTNELAKRITFTSKSHNDDTVEEEFVSLYETKMPEEMKHTSRLIREERSVDSIPRARTSTPVQIFKSMTYRSSSSSNMSNGLFSNADDLSSVKGTSNSLRNHSTSDKDDLTIPNFSLRTRKGLSDCSKSD